MNVEKIHEIRDAVRESSPLIHGITNPISIHQCANATLAVGGRPIMAEHPEEVREITATAQALVLNLGNITDTRMRSMLLAGEAAEKAGIPLVLDLVGIACSRLRREFAVTILKGFPITAIKGNYSEIYALYQEEYQSAGVDADGTVSGEQAEKAAVALAKKYHTFVLASGSLDLITDGKEVVSVKNGTPRLASVTGTGCMLGVLCGCYLSACCAIDALITACAVLGVCGELAESALGNGSFFTGLMDRLSVLSKEELENHIKWEEKAIENL